jgi:hypothetical protein
MILEALFVRLASKIDFIPGAAHKSLINSSLLGFKRVATITEALSTIITFPDL